MRSSINNLAPTVSINRHWCETRRRAKSEGAKGERQRQEDPRGRRDLTEAGGGVERRNCERPTDRVSYNRFTYSQRRAVLSLESLSFSRTRLQAARSDITRDTSRRQIDRLCRTGADWE